MEPDLKKYLQIMVKMIIVLLALVIFFVVVHWIFPILGDIVLAVPMVLAPFIIAFLLAIVLDPLISWMQNRLRMHRTWAVLLSLLLTFGGLGGILMVIIHRLARELAGLYELANASSADIIFNFTKILNDLQLAYLQLNLPENLQQSFINGLEAIVGQIEEILSASATWLVGILINLPQMFIFLLIVAVATFFVARDWRIIRRKGLALIPEEQKVKASFLFNDLARIFVGFLKAEATLVSITALWYIVGLKVIGIDYALTIGLIAGLLDILPVVGPGLVIVPWIIWAFVIGNIKLGIGLLVLYLLASAVRQILEPRILGNNIGLHPLVTLLSLYVGLQLGGVVGMLLGPILVVLVISMFKAGVFDDIKWFKKRP